ncbi:MAG TPA: type 4a pilus biogenesis protein PilO [Methylotenera sp.]|nr:type 4a pilus biogenesis protein PilO [Methylotenera sp.]
MTRFNLDTKGLQYAHWLFGQFAKKLGVWGLLGVAILLASLVFYLTNIIKLEQQLSNAELNLAQQQLNNNNKNKIVLRDRNLAPEQNEAQRINQFYEMLPDGANLPKLLSAIDTNALKQHLVLNRGDYKLTQTKQGKLSRYEIVLPVTGQYIQIRQFIAEVLVQIPALALSDIQIKRENTLMPHVEARLVFVLFLKGDSW